jgi:hypothetical protein
MTLRRTTWGIALLYALAISACGGDDTPTPDFSDAAISTGGAGGAANDASMGSDTSTGKSGGTGTDSGMVCKKTAAMAVTGQDIGLCKASLAEAGTDSGDDAGASCLACLCTNCPAEAKTCDGNPYCKAVSDCCRAYCKCPSLVNEAGSDGPAADAPATDGPATTDAPADTSPAADANEGG